MTKISAWLNEHGLGKYVDSFETSDITYDLLEDLNQEDLRELGLSLGHQKKFLKLIETITGGNNKTVSSAATTPAATTPSDAASASERRQLTVMFCDLADSTALVNRIGAEEMQEVFRDYQDACTLAVQRFNGYIAKYLGDGVMAYFGYPQAHELDPDRAIRAGLNLIELTQELDKKYQKTIGVKVAVRIGIATGPVVVGDIIGQGVARELAVVGETPNLAARIQSLAPLDTVTVSELTRRLASPAFNFGDQGRHQVKGFLEPIHVWTAISKRNIDSRFRATRMSGNTELIGRREELTALKSCWHDVTKGEGKLISISGEAGIGKSHLIEAFLEQSQCPEQRCLRFQCSPYHTGTILFPVLEQIERELESAMLNSAQDFAGLLSCFAENAACREDAARYFGSLLSISMVNADPDEELSAQALQQRAFRGWSDSLAQRASVDPIIMVLEDAHWLDATSVGLFSQLINSLHRYPLLLIVASRHDFESPWKNAQCNAREIILLKLDKRDGMEIINRVSGGYVLPVQIRELILGKTDGVPLFVEELTKSVIEHAQQDDQSVIDDVDALISALDIPETLNDLLMSRLDKEPSVKGVAQIGAAIGRDFAYELLASVAPHEEQELQSVLSAVVSSDLVFESGSLPTAIYTFRHALLQDAAYGSLLKKNRRILHAKIAESMGSGRLEGTPPEIIAHHWTQAEQPAKAVHCWQQAARDAASVWANVEAINRYKKALTAFDLQEESERSTELQIELLLELGEALRAVSGSSAKETIDVFDRATELSQIVGNVDLCVRSYYGYFATHFTAARLNDAQKSASRLLALSIDNKHLAGTAAARQALGMHAFATGNLAVAKEQLELALEYKQQFNFDFDVQYPVLSQSYLCWTLYFLGQKTAASELAAQAVSEAESVSAYNHALVMANTCYLHQFEDNVEILESMSTRLKVLAEAKGFPVWYAVADFFDSWQLCRRNASQSNLDNLVKALDFWAEDEIETPYFKAIVAEMLLHNNRLVEGEKLAREAQTLMRETGEIWYKQQLETTCSRYLS